MSESSTVAKLQVERRTTERYPIDDEKAYRLRVRVGDDERPAEVLDLSANGLRLVLDHPFLPGTLVTLALGNSVQLFSRTLRLRVVHVMERDDGHYVIGGELSRALDHEELLALLA